MLSDTKDTNTIISKKPRRWLIILMTLTILVVMSSLGVVLYQNHVTTEQANKTATAIAQTATAQHNAYLSALSGNGKLVFSDPLSQESGSQWSFEQDDTICRFSGGAYHIIPQGEYFKECDAKSGIYSNFAFEVNMKIIGKCAGIVFRSDDHGMFYYFNVYSDGKYDIARYADYGIFEHLLPYGRSSAIRTGSGQQNKIAVRANGSTLTFFINEQQIQELHDYDGYALGNVGLSAYLNFGNEADIAYTNARLWTL